MVFQLKEAFLTAVPLLPKNAPFSPEEINVLNKVVSRTTPLQRSWLAGFFAGFEAAQGGQAAPAAAARPRVPLTVLYASESGNAEGFAIKAKKAAQKHGLDARVVDMADADMGLLAKAKNLVVYASTWGEGDPPSRAAGFYHALMSDGAPRLDGVRFAVLALGDTSYAQFCATGKVIDARLEALGATRAADRIDLDLDFAKQAVEWTQGALAKLAPTDAPSSTVVHVDFHSSAQAADEDAPLYTAETPLEAEIMALINLNGTGSTRETWHVELASDAPGFTYVPGDAVGIVPENDPDLAGEVAAAAGLGSDAVVLQKLRQSYDAVAAAGRGVCKTDGPRRRGQAQGAGGVRQVRARPPACRSLPVVSREAVSGPALRPPKAAAGPALLGRIKPEGAPWRGASSRRRGAVGLVRQGAQGRSLEPSRRPAPHW